MEERGSGVFVNDAGALQESPRQAGTCTNSVLPKAPNFPSLSLLLTCHHSACSTWSRPGARAGDAGTPVALSRLHLRPHLAPWDGSLRLQNTRRIASWDKQAEGITQPGRGVPATLSARGPSWLHVTCSSWSLSCALERSVPGVCHPLVPQPTPAASDLRPPAADPGPL